MKSPLAQDTANSAKTLAQQIAKQMAREPLEIFKDIREQATGEELAGKPANNEGEKSPPENPKDQAKLIEHQQELQDKMKSNRLLEALNRELDDINKQKIFKDLQARIANGEEISLEEYPELSMEQKQVLMAQMEAVKKQMLNAKYANDKSIGVPSVVSKPSRRFGAGQKKEAEKQQTHVEKPIPPS